MIARFWCPTFRANYGGDWPTNYCAFDLETSGGNREKDVILEWGHCLVEEGRVVNRLGFLLDWTNHPVVPDDWLRSRLAYMRQQAQEKGKPWHLTYERLREEGVKPEKALHFCWEFIQNLLARKVLFVAHNGYQFDEPMLEGNFVGFEVAPSFSFGDNGLFDTEVLERCNQSIDIPEFHPLPGESLRSYFDRLKYKRRKGLKSSLDSLLPKYGFEEKYNLRPQDLHNAEVDSYAVHLLMQTYGNLLAGPEIARITPEPRLPAKAPQPAERLVPFPPGQVRYRGQRNR